MSTKEGLDPKTIERMEVLTRELFRLIERLGGNRYQDGISFSQYKILFTVHDMGPCSLGRIGSMVGVAQSTTSEMVARMEKSGLLKKTRGQFDSRVVDVSITDQGRKVLDKRRKVLRRSYAALFAEHDAGTMRDYLSSLETVVLVLGRTGKG